jgi:hypothetical protein
MLLRLLEGALTGDPATGDDTLRFSVLSAVSTMIETMPLEKAVYKKALTLAGPNDTLLRCYFKNSLPAYNGGNS